MPRFADLDAALDDVLELPVPVAGRPEPKVYRIPAMSAKHGLYAQRMMNLVLAATLEEQRPVDPDKPAPPPPPVPVLEGQDEQDFYELVLSVSLLEEMLADGVTWPLVQHVALTAFLWATSDAETAQAYWTGGGRGKALTGRPGSRRTASSAGRAGPSGTKASPKARKKARSRGSGSSSGGH